MIWELYHSNNISKLWNQKYGKSVQKWDRKCIWVGNESLAKFNITSEQNELPCSFSQKYLVECNKKYEAYEEKKVHSYYKKKLKNDNEIDI